MIEHPAPTPATVRYLYGVARECAFPSCAEPLYKLVDGLPRRALNSTVAHIHARREGGPRWNAAMSPEDNRASGNLILLCKFHSSTIDDFEDEYPPNMLRSWKEEAESPGIGIQLSDAEVAEVSRVWISQAINLQAHTIMVGGTLGGGGGAIGAGAFGGRGGDIRQFPELTKLLRPTVTASENDLGKGGVPGFDGPPGGPSAISTEDGEVLVVAGGGGGGVSGTGERLVSDRLDVSTLMFANALDIRDELVFALGGAWGTWTVGGFPEPARVMALMVVEAGHVPIGEYTLNLDVHDPSGARLARVSFPVVVESAGAVLRIPQAIALEVTWAEAGRHALVASSDLGELRSIEIVVLPPPASG